MAGDLSEDLIASIEGVSQARYFEEIDSTNTHATDWARRGAPHGALVVADHQVAGKGRLGRGWQDAPGTSLMFSLVVSWRHRPETLGLLGLLAAWTWAEVLGGLGFDAGVKWPNDVLVGGRKIAGILSEAVDGSLAVVGMGINVEQNQTDFPEEFADRATSLRIALGQRSIPAQLDAGGKLHRGELLRAYLGKLFPALGHLDPPSIIEAYRKRCVTLGKEVSVETPGGTDRGIAVAVDETGALVLEGGGRHAVGDVIHLR